MQRFRLLRSRRLSEYMQDGSIEPIMWKHDVIHKTGSTLTYRNATWGVPSHGHNQHATKVVKFGRVLREMSTVVSKLLSTGKFVEYTQIELLIATRIKYRIAYS